jgi:hypothetical protein
MESISNEIAHTSHQYSAPSHAPQTGTQVDKPCGTSCIVGLPGLILTLGVRFTVKWVLLNFGKARGRSDVTANRRDACTVPSQLHLDA